MTDSRTADEPTQEPEVIVAQLKELGCPYPAGEGSATIWLEGYRAGFEAAGKLLRGKG